MKPLWKALGPNRPLFLFALFAGEFFVSVSILSTTVSGEVVTSVISNSDRRAAILTAYIVLSALQVILSQVDMYSTEKFKIRQKEHLRRASFRAFSCIGGADHKAISGFVSFINNDIPCLTEQYFAGTIDIIKCITMLTFSACSLLYIHWVMAAVVLGVSVMIVLAPKWLGKKDGKVREELSKGLGRYNAILQSFLNGKNLIKAYLYQQRSNELLDLENRRVEKAESAVMKRSLLIYSITGVLQVSKTVLIFIIGLFLIRVGQISIGGLVAVIQLAAIISSPIEVLAYLFHAKNEVRPMLERFNKLTASYEKAQPEAGKDVGRAQEITVSHLSYSVGGLTILKDISIQFQRGKKYVIMGESGSGKSTFLRLLSHIGDDSYEGDILMNSTDISDISPRSFYSEVRPVFQEPYMFFASLEENICLGRDIPQNLYRGVVSKLNLDHLLERYGGEEIAPETVEKMSGGEKQRIALARAMVGRPSVYLLDEITSALDPENARIIEAAILSEDAMVINISHRMPPEWRARYDQMLNLKDGRLLYL